MGASCVRMQAAPMFTSLLEEAIKLVRNCTCEEVTGCPGCVQFTCCDQYNAVLHKQSALVVLHCTLEAELELAAKGAAEAGSAAGLEV
jgi:ATP-dependent helicase YprA (DUF1998 family)